MDIETLNKEIKISVESADLLLRQVIHHLEHGDIRHFEHVRIKLALTTLKYVDTLLTVELETNAQFPPSDRERPTIHMRGLGG